MARRNVGPAKIPAEQGEEREVGPGHPPREYQWKPGESGNPNGPPKRRTNLWVWFCKYMDMTDAELAMLAPDKLTAAQQTALSLVHKAKAGEGCGAERMARYIVDREEGRAVERLVVGLDDPLTDDECDRIREVVLRNHADVDQ